MLVASAVRFRRGARRLLGERLVLVLPLVVASLAVLYAGITVVARVRRDQTGWGVADNLLGGMAHIVLVVLLLELAVFAHGMWTTWRASERRFTWLRFMLHALLTGGVFAWFLVYVLELTSDWCVPLIALGNMWLLVLGVRAGIRRGFE